MPAPARVPTAPASPPSPSDRPTGPHRGLSLRPRDAIDPYTLGRFAPDACGISQLTVWCPHCNSSLLVVELRMTPQGLYVEAVCYTCRNHGGEATGIYKRLRIPLPFGTLPSVEE